MNTDIRCAMRKKQSAFTLIELLVVVAIITILIAILIPSLNSARRQAKRVKCQSNMRSMGMIVSLYASEYNNYAPIGSASENMQSNYWFNRDGEKLNLFGRFWHAGLLNSPQVAFCPEMKDPLHGFDTSSNKWPPEKNENLPSARNVRSSYSMRADYRIQWVNENAPSVSVFVNSYPATLQASSLPKLNVFERKTIMTDLIRNPNQVALGHIDGMVFLRSDASVGWQKYNTISTFLTKVTETFETKNNRWIVSIFDAMDANN